MFRTYKLKNLNIKLIIGILALTILGILIIGSADAGLPEQADLRYDPWYYRHGDRGTD